MDKIIVLFKTHLDIGFTDFAKHVVDNYLENYLPNAMKVAREMRDEEEGFIWTTGSWLIEKYLEESNDRNMLTDAIEHGEVRWHGLPFTTHTELMDAELFQYGLGISKKLDIRFRKQTIAAKMTDVPGHTKAMIPYLVNAGIKFLHIGVNPASTRPDVPDLFRWRADSGEELIVMYHNDYGELTEIGNSKTAVCFAHTGDNSGPQSADQIREIYKKLHEKYPDAKLCPGTLEDVAEIAIQEHDLPVIRSEIGDTWIHGSGTDPKKISQYRALLRLKNDEIPIEMEKIYKKIILIPEHTWGLDEKTYLGMTREIGYIQGEHGYFIRKEFEHVRYTDKFQIMEASWEEQREYLNNAVNQLEGEEKNRAALAVSEYKRDPVETSGYETVKPDQNLFINGYLVQINQFGAICRLEHEGEIIADENHLLGNVIYEIFSQEDYDRFREQYVTSDETWALEDFGKTGVEKVVRKYQKYQMDRVQVFRKDKELVIKLTMSGITAARYGGFESADMRIIFEESSVKFDFAWFGKKANRCPESFWIGFCPIGRVTGIQKLGTWIDPEDVVDGGNKRMHAADEEVRLEKAVLKTLDAPLVNMGEPSLLNFTNEPVCVKQGVYVNLYNNIWGTNFPMWYDEDARFRFVLEWL
ncbi:DUF5054 domain-containing protein [Robinsoniella sp. KNHs210]|uniref:DUF5054 domain-containing protein n=1 Tax=Robinsoniella sp. KNHs210 TaxID=1469950 RepID=UPI000486CD48|nr:DUF5054 domain-containing protein [Robinsoniella sp. KNHs210]